MDLDDTDHRLIALLRDDARMPVATLAKRLQLARGTVQNRLARLEREGVIVGYTVRLKPLTVRTGLRALMTIAAEGNQATQVLHALRGNPHITALRMTNGRWDIVAELQTDSLAEFEQLLSSLRRLPGIASSETSLLLSTQKLG